MEFGKQHDTRDTTDFWPRQLVTDLLHENWCNGFNRGKSSKASTFICPWQSVLLWSVD